MAPTQRPTTSASALRRCLGGWLLFAGVIAGPAALADDATTLIVPTASGYFLSAPAAPNPVSSARPGSAARDEGLPAVSAARDCAADNPLCELRWTTGRTRGSDIKARYYEMTDGVKTRLVGRSRAEYFDLDLDSSPEFRFELRF